MPQFFTKPQTITAVRYKESEAEKSLPWRVIQYGMGNGGVPAVEIDGGDETIWVAEGEWIVEFPDSTMVRIMTDDEFQAIVERQVTRTLMPTNAETFFATAKAGEVCTYASLIMTFDEVKRIAEEAGVRIVYCDPRTQEYLDHGAAAFKIVWP